jgi:hypothetical protein
MMATSDTVTGPAIAEIGGSAGSFIILRMDTDEIVVLME